MKRVISLLLVLLMVVGLFAACKPDTNNPNVSNPTGNNSSTGNTNVPEDSETPLNLAWFQSMGIETLFENPHTDDVSLYPMAIFEVLARFDTNANEMVWLLATGCTHNDAYDEWTLTVREGVKWHDGEDFTTDDVIFSIYSGIMNPKGNTVNDFEYLVGREEFVEGEADTISGITVDGNNITFKFEKPWGTFDKEALGMYILPAHLLGNTDYAEVNTSTFWMKPIGTGPYMITEVEFPDYFNATRFEGYWGKPAGVKNLHFTAYDAGGTDAAIMAMAAGNLDYLNSQIMTDANLADYLKAQNDDIEILNMKSYAIRYMVFNIDQRQDGNNKDALATPEGRKAISMLIDETKIQQFYPTMASNTETMVPTFDPMYAKDLEQNPEPAYDVEKAKELLDEAGWDYADTLDIAYYYNDQTSVDLMDMVVQDLAAAGVKAKAILLTGNLSEGIYTVANYDVLYGAGGAWAVSPANMYESWIIGGSANFLGDERNPARIEFTELYEKYFTALSEADRTKYAIELQTMNYEHCWAFPLFARSTIEVYNSAHLQLPVEHFEAGNRDIPCWDQWKILH